jgi:hypothetical protein
MTAFKSSTSGHTIHVGYSTNVHRAERLDDVLTFLDRATVPIRNRLGLDGRAMGLDLRIGSALARELAGDPDKVDRLRERLAEHDLYVFGVNGFPLGDFQADVVKRAVYRPDWREPGRRDDTLIMGRVLARLLPPGIEGAVSTVAGGYRPMSGDDRGTRDAMARALVDVAAAFADLHQETGRRIALAPEPEPDTTMDDCDSVLSFYREHVFPAASRLGPRGEDVVHRHLPVCLDACHLSVMFEDPGETISTLQAAGVRVGKSNISCCPAVPDPSGNEAGRRFLLALHEPRFLHQTMGRDRSGSIRLRLPDLDALAGVAPAELEGIAEIRSHFHVPLHGAGGEGFTTTRNETETFIQSLLGNSACEALAVETYTWHVLDQTPLGREAGSDLVAGLAEELRWTLERVQELGWRPEE